MHAQIIENSNDCSLHWNRLPVFQRLGLCSPPVSTAWSLQSHHAVFTIVSLWTRLVSTNGCCSAYTPCSLCWSSIASSLVVSSVLTSFNGLEPYVWLLSVSIVYGVSIVCHLCLVSLLCVFSVSCLHAASACIVLNLRLVC